MEPKRRATYFSGVAGSLSAEQHAAMSKLATDDLPADFVTSAAAYLLRCGTPLRDSAVLAEARKRLAYQQRCLARARERRAAA